jgi:SAM-dependent methyltransferase
MASILETGKGGYDADAEFDERTSKALRARGRDDRLFVYDAVEVESFVSSDYRAVVPVLAKLKGYRLLDLGCGYGRLAPLLSAFDCAEYLGVDRVGGRIEYARGRYGSGVCRFEEADALEFRPGPRFDVVWTSNVLQHFPLDDKLRLVETAKRARAPGGVILLREAEIVDLSRADAERRYASDGHARHMIPIPFGEVACALEPLRFRKLGGIVYAATDNGL